MKEYDPYNCKYYSFKSVELYNQWCNQGVTIWFVGVLIANNNTAGCLRKKMVLQYSIYMASLTNRRF